jgi:two-component system LytT family response regulator
MQTMKKMKALIIDDESPARDIIIHYLKNHENVELAGECSDGFAGLKLIKEMKPDLVFLDIQMPKLNGFEMLEVLEEKPEIIFTTAYDQFAIQAFEKNAVDYLLKPFYQTRFDEAIKKAIERIRSGNNTPDIMKRLLSIKTENSAPINRIVVKKGNSINIIPVESVKYITAEDDYVMIYHSAGKALKQQTMKYYEENLPEKSFARIHRSFIVKIEEINRLEPYGKDNYVAVLHNGDKLPVSRAGYKLLKNELSF